MDQSEKRKKAAICGVIAYLQMKESQKNEWSRSGKELIMKNRQMVQTKMFNRRES